MSEFLDGLISLDQMTQTNDARAINISVFRAAEKLPIAPLSAYEKNGPSVFEDVGANESR